MLQPRPDTGLMGERAPYRVRIPTVQLNDLLVVEDWCSSLVWQCGRHLKHLLVTRHLLGIPPLHA